MRAQQLVAPRTFELVDVPRPDVAALGSGEVLLRVLAGGICGSDLPYFAGQPRGTQPPAPGFPMHEVVGEVVASRSGLRVGARVVGWARGFDAIAQYAVCAAEELAPYDPAIRAEHAVVIQPLACALYAVGELGAVEGRDAAILGFGPMGALFAAVLRARGARRIVAVDRVDRRAEATAFGVDETVVASAHDWAAGGARDDAPEIVVEAIGHQDGIVAAAIHGVRAGGQIYAFGIPEPDVQPIPLLTLLRKGVTVRTGVTLNRAAMLEAAGRFLATAPGLAERLVTDVVAFEDIQSAFERAEDPRSGRLKIVMEAP